MVSFFCHLTRWSFQPALNVTNIQLGQTCSLSSKLKEQFNFWFICKISARSFFVLFRNRGDHHCQLAENEHAPLNIRSTIVKNKNGVLYRSVGSKKSRNLKYGCCNYKNLSFLVPIFFTILCYQLNFFKIQYFIDKSFNFFLLPSFVGAI